MDTRKKIVPLERVPAVVANGYWLAIVGQFDPLTSTQARRVAGFRNIGRKILAIVVSSEDALLPAEARAALIAALREVDAVTIAGREDWRPILENRGSVEVIEDFEGERARTAEFVQFVIARQNA